MTTPRSSLSEAGYWVACLSFIVILLFLESMLFIGGRLKAASRLHSIKRKTASEWLNYLSTWAKKGLRPRDCRMGQHQNQGFTLQTCGVSIAPISTRSPSGGKTCIQHRPNGSANFS